MRKLSYLLSLLGFSVLFVACDVDFTPNQQWQESMMVYCLMDQDDDTTFVRVEKVYLGQGNALEYAQNKDSIYYRENELDVRILVYNINDTMRAIDTLKFLYTTTEKPQGTFYSGQAPLYYCITKNKVFPNKFYRLEVKNLNTGYTATSSTYLISDYSIQNSNFTFNTSSGKKMIVKWSNVDGYQNVNTIAKRFQVNVRFNYRKNAKIYHVDMPLATQTNTSTNPKDLTTTLNREDIVSFLAKELENEAGKISWYDAAPFELNVLACDQQMFDYISINNATEVTINYKPSYSNIEGGYGLFAARRQHISRSYNTSQVDQNLRIDLQAAIHFQ